ncbi:hypothetical protein [Rhodanobacter sp. L36]|uniref:hypothetical protein n=1 Tax=Rhodanobacter sp. L36 TaxID=1747221 RepID=UPI00131DA5B6|nr:hypothetical protein [Rhodanobacter sp. L36]
MSDFPQALIWLANNVFGILASIAGIVVACVLWSRASRAAMLLLIASILQLVLMIIASWFYVAFLPHHEGAIDMAHMVAISGLVLGFLHAIVYGLLIWAIATGRGVQLGSAPVVSRG